MNQLNVFSHNGVQVADSREVAESIKKRHDNLMRDISGYIAVMEKNNALKSEVVNFFIPSTYVDNKGELRPCFLCTKKGCDMVANKTTGEKGVVFTAAYILAFEKMEERLQLTAPQGTFLNASLGELRGTIREFRLLMSKGYTQAEVTGVIKMVCDQAGLQLPDYFVKKPLWEDEQMSLAAMPTVLIGHANIAINSPKQ